MNNTKGLTKNPLGIIALFVSLIYGFACLVLSTSISNMHNNTERLPLIWFIILFPLIILIAFIYLVVNHHEKLYSPSDFRGDDSFIFTIDERKRKLKIKEEVENLEASPKSYETKENKNDNSEIETIITNQNLETKSIIDSEKQINKDYTEEELMQIYSNSEEWAVNELSLKYNVSFKSNVKLRTQNDTLELDGYATGNGITYVAEVKYWQSSRSNKRLKLTLQEFLSKRSRFERSFLRKDKELKIIVALVYDDLTNVLRSELITFVREIGGDNVILELFDYNDLKKSYE